jgi:predicted aconitase with swiveling domain
MRKFSGLCLKVRFNVDGENTRIFKGNPILPGKVEGEAVVSLQGFNTYTSFLTSMYAQEKEAKCSDRNNPKIYGKVLTGKVICLPKTIGSTSSGAVWTRVVELGIAPQALLFSGKIDSLAAGGVIVAEVWAGKRIVTVDRLGEEFLKNIMDGDRIVIREDGIVELWNVRGF